MATAEAIWSFYNETNDLASVTTPTLPTGYHHLKVMIAGGGTSITGYYTYWIIQFNSDTGTNYWMNNHIEANGTAYAAIYPSSAEGQLGSDETHCDQRGSDTHPLYANPSSGLILDIYGQDNSSADTSYMENGAWNFGSRTDVGNSAKVFYKYLQMGNWTNTADITSMKFDLDNGYINRGTSIDIYGYKSS